MDKKPPGSGGVDIPGRADVQGHLVGGNFTENHNHVHVHGDSPPAELDITAHLQALLPTVEKIEIVGITSGPGRSRDALICPIEQLYTPLATRREPVGHKSDARHLGRVRLPELLPAHRRLLLIGQPGAGKTTFARLVACMLARDILDPTRKPPWRSEYLGLPANRPAPVPAFVRMASLVGLFEKHSAPGRPDDRIWLLDLLAGASAHRSNVTAPDPRDHASHRDAWDALLSRGEVLLLLDGLDEVADATLRARVLRVFQDACRAWPGGIVVTSRPIELEMLRALDFHEATLEPFGPAEVDRFVGQWTAALYADRLGLAADHEELLRAAIREHPEIRRIATNPVMLTCLCVIHWNEGRLPEGRARVYRAVFNWMLAARSEQRARAGYTNVFAENAFASIALAMMRTPEGKLATFDVADAAAAIDEEMQRDFSALAPAQRRRQAREWVLRECEWSHIIEEIAGNQLRYWHLTLQEFLAALALAWRDDGDGPEDWWPLTADRFDNPQWHETLTLLPGCLFDEGGRRRVDRLFERVLHLERVSDGGVQRGRGAPAGARQSDLAAVARVVGVVGRLLAPMSAYAYTLKPQHATLYEALRDRVLAIFTREGAAAVPLKTRIAAADALGRAGDPRLREDNFVEIPGTRVAMGRFPVTIEEFRRFVEDEGYSTEHFWDPRGWAWRREQTSVAPGEWDDQQLNPSRPVTWVTWYEARAYCRWLHACCPRYAEVRLPTVQEWEQAASPDGRKFPWGDEAPTEALANFGKHVGAPTPVGLYPAGIGPAGHLDLTGNVDEWCNDGPDHIHRRIKGGNWLSDNVEWLTAAFSVWYRRVNDSGGGLGFRVVVAARRRPRKKNAVPSEFAPVPHGVRGKASAARMA